MERVTADSGLPGDNDPTAGETDSQGDPAPAAHETKFVPRLVKANTCETGVNGPPDPPLEAGRSAPASAEIVAFDGIKKIADCKGDRVAPGGDVMKAAQVAGTETNLVNGRIEKTDGGLAVGLCLLVHQGGIGGPQRSRATGATHDFTTPSVGDDEDIVRRQGHIPRRCSRSRRSNSRPFPISRVRLSRRW